MFEFFFKHSCTDLVDLKPTKWTLCLVYFFCFIVCCYGELLGGDCICFVCFFISRTVDSNVGGHKGEDDFEECEEVQGQIAKQGKQPLLVCIS
jgi:hypothetical protein